MHRLAEASPARHCSPVRVAIAGPSISVEGYPYRSNASVTSSTSADYNHLASTIPPIPESARLLATALRRSPADRVWIELPGLGRLDIGPGLFFKVGSGLLDPAHRLICPTPSTWSSERQDSLHLWSVPVGVITDTWLETSSQGVPFWQSAVMRAMRMKQERMLLVLLRAPLLRSMVEEMQMGPLVSLGPSGLAMTSSRSAAGQMW